MAPPQIVSRQEWLAQRTALLEAEKAQKRAADALAERRRALPWVEVTEDYRFRGSDGTVGLDALFGPHSQLVVYHFMFGEGWKKGCPSCSFWADHFEGPRQHLAHRDVQLVAVSSAPWPTLSAYAKRTGWKFGWYSSGGSRFNADFHVSLPQSGPRSYNYQPSEGTGEMPGVSVFIKHDGRIFHTYSCYARGLEPLNSTYGILDLVPKGRDEQGLPWAMAWVKRLIDL